MSCIVVNDATLDAVVFGAQLVYSDPREYEPELWNGPWKAYHKNPDDIKQVLHRENVRAYNKRYPEHATDDFQTRKFDRHATYDVGEVWGAVQCYLYQIADLPDWELNQPVRQYVERIEQLVIKEAFRRLGVKVPYGIGGHDILER